MPTILCLRSHLFGVSGVGGVFPKKGVKVSEGYKLANVRGIGYVCKAKVVDS